MRANQVRRGFEVEWCSHIPILEGGESDLDNATIEFRDFPTIEAARTFAKVALEKDCFGAVQINEFELVPFEPGFPGLTREYIGSTEYVEAD